MFSFDGGLERLPLLFQHAVRQHSSPLLYTCSLSYEIPRSKLPATSFDCADLLRRIWSQNTSLRRSFIYDYIMRSPAVLSDARCKIITNWCVTLFLEKFSYVLAPVCIFPAAATDSLTMPMDGYELMWIHSTKAILLNWVTFNGLSFFLLYHNNAII